ncbi:MAG TPA: hypothetical protein VFG51_03470 [Candidatus Saccharimonadia bacterium]|nr:hypothetical protein [Candidatus Saccharimonadia bacterium]
MPDSSQQFARASQDQFQPAGAQLDPNAPPVQVAPEEVLLVWDAASRPYKKRDREYYTTIAIIIFLLSIILFFAGQFLLIAVIVAFGFVSYMLASIAPENTSHAITTYGIRTGDKLYHWAELGRFWFTDRLGQRVLHVEYFHRIIGSLLLLLGDVKEEEVKSILLDYLPNETPMPTFVEKASQWLQKKIPLDKN